MSDIITLASDSNQKPSDGLPSTLYKYRNWCTPFHSRVITEREVYLSSAEEFNDPFDARFTLRYDLLSDEDLRKRLTTSFVRGEPQAGANRVRAQVDNAFQNMRDPEYLADFHERKHKANNEAIGVFCMSTQRDNILMWSHYANSHKGFVAGFDTDILFHDVSPTVCGVNYQDEYPMIIPGLGMDTPQELYEVYSTKSSLWAYEDEVRMFKVYAARKTFIYRPEALREIIFGCNISADDKKKITEAASVFPDVKLFQATISQREFALEIHRL